MPICVQESPKRCFSTAWGMGAMRPHTPSPLRGSVRAAAGARHTHLRVSAWRSLEIVRGNHSPALFVDYKSTILNATRYDATSL